MIVERRNLLRRCTGAKQRDGASLSPGASIVHYLVDAFGLHSSNDVDECAV